MNQTSSCFAHFLCEISVLNAFGDDFEYFKYSAEYSHKFSRFYNTVPIANLSPLPFEMFVKSRRTCRLLAGLLGLWKKTLSPIISLATKLTLEGWSQVNVSYKT